MPWIIYTGSTVYTAATISAEEDTYEDRTWSEESHTLRFPVMHLSAVIEHTPEGTRTPRQDVTLRGAGTFEVTWTPAPELEQDDAGHWHPTGGGTTR